MEDTSEQVFCKENGQSWSCHHFTKRRHTEIWVPTPVPRHQQRIKIAKSIGAKNVLLKSDSKLVIRQIKRDYEVKE